MLGAGAGEHVVDLDVGVDPGRDLAEDLHQRVLAEGDRGVRLLAREERRVGVEVELVAGQPVEGQAAGEVGAVAAGLAGGAAKARSHSAHRLAVVERVVRVHPAEVRLLPPAEEGVVEPGLGLGVEGQRHLVDLGAARAVVVGDLDQVDHHPEAVAAARAARRSGVRRSTENGRPLPPNQRVRSRYLTKTSGSARRSAASQQLTLLGGFRGGQPEPVEAVAGQGQQVGQLADLGERHAAQAARRASGPGSGAGRARPAAGSATGC